MCISACWCFVRWAHNEYCEVILQTSTSILTTQESTYIHIIFTLLKGKRLSIKYYITLFYETNIKMYILICPVHHCLWVCRFSGIQNMLQVEVLLVSGCLEMMPKFFKQSRASVWSAFKASKLSFLFNLHPSLFPCCVNQDIFGQNRSYFNHKQFLHRHVIEHLLCSTS